MCAYAVSSLILKGWQVLLKEILKNQGGGRIKMKKLTTIVMSVAMLLGVGLMVVPQAMAGGSVFDSFKLPYGLEFGKPLPEKVKRVFSYDKKYHRYSYGEDTRLYIKNNGLQTVVFKKRMPRAWSKLGLHLGLSPEQVKVILHKAGLQNFSIDKFDDEGSSLFGKIWNFNFTIGPYGFRMNFGGHDELRFIAVDEALTEDW